MLLDVAFLRLRNLIQGLTGQQIIDQAKLVVANIPGIIVEISEQEGGPAFENPIEIGIFGNTEMRLSR